MDQMRGLEADFDHKLWRQVLRSVRSSSMAGSTTGAKTRTTITCA